MKKQFLLFSALAFSVMAMAQNTTPSVPEFGIRAGLSSSGMKGEAVNSLQGLLDYTDGMITKHNRTGVFASAYTSIPVSEAISIEPSLGYGQKGYELKGELNIKGAEFIGANAKAQLTTHYVDLPVVIKANLGGFQLFAGPQVSYLVQADLRTTAGVMGFNIFNKKMDATEELNRWDAGVTGGVGYQFTNGLNLTAAYDHGLSRTDANKDFEAYNRALKVGIGFSF